MATLLLQTLLCMVLLLRVANGKQDKEEEESPGKSYKQKYADLRKSVESIRKSCGQLCDTTVKAKVK